MFHVSAGLVEASVAEDGHLGPSSRGVPVFFLALALALALTLALVVALVTKAAGVLLC